MIKVVAIIQARMGSTRLPGKVMLNLGDKSVLSHVVARVGRTQGIDEVIVATSTLAPDDIIQNEVKRLGGQCFRGSETDVLGRYYSAAKLYAADVIIRVTADCPFVDPALLADMLKNFLSCIKNGTKVAYLSNCMVRTYPRGLDAEIFTMQALQRAHSEAFLDYQREHVTPYIYQNPHIFSLCDYVNNEDLSHYRWTLDTKEDYEFISRIHEELAKSNADITTNDILALLKQKPWLLEINKHIAQKEFTTNSTISAEGAA